MLLRKIIIFLCFSIFWNQLLTAAPLLTTEVIPHQYIVTLKKDASITHIEDVMHGDHPFVSVNRVFHNIFNGYVAEIPDDHLSFLEENPDVAMIEPDLRLSLIYFNEQTTESPILKALAAPGQYLSWGLDRIDQSYLPLDHQYYSDWTGKGVDVYVIDTGIRKTHHDLEGRMGRGFSTLGDDYGENDCNGHGTHVAATVGGLNYGVAKGVTLHAVRVLGCNGEGSTSGLIAGLDWVKATRDGPAVANISLGGSVSVAVDSAVRSLIASGVTTVVAAGNSNTDACIESPSRVSEAITVGATNQQDERAKYSNYGTCVDLFAPGSDITSAWIHSDSDQKTISGTSMATPHVAGVVALSLEMNPTDTPAQVKNRLLKAAVPGQVKNTQGSPNYLLQSRLEGGFSNPEFNELKDQSPPQTPDESSSTPRFPSQPVTPVTPGHKNNLPIQKDQYSTYQGYLKDRAWFYYQPRHSYQRSHVLQDYFLEHHEDAQFSIVLLWSPDNIRWEAVAYSQPSFEPYQRLTYRGLKGYYMVKVTAQNHGGHYTLYNKR